MKREKLLKVNIRELLGVIAIGLAVRVGNPE